MNSPITHRSITINDTVAYNQSESLDDFVHRVLDCLDVAHGSFEFTLVDNATITDINIAHLDRDYATDIISFNLGTVDDIEGDVYISIEKATENAGELGIPQHEEVCRLVVHGILHLLDYQDYTEDERAHMFSKQEAILKELGVL